MFYLRIITVLTVIVVVSQLPASAQRKSDSRLVRMLTGRNETVRMNSLMRMRYDRELLAKSYDELLIAIERQTESLAESELPPSMVEMIALVSSVERPESETVLVSLLDSENADIAMLSADALGRKRFFGAIDDLHRQTERPEYAARYSFRFNLIRALSMMKHPDAVEVLGELELKLDGQLRYEVGKILSEVTVDDFRGDEERYQAWLKRDEKSSVFRPIKFSKENTDPAYDPIQFAGPQYYGINIRAGRVMFVIDHSGSMKAPTSSGSRLLRAKHELIRAIRDLPEDTEFAIMAFESNVRVWREELSLATEEDKRAAILYVQRLGFGDDTNTYGALRRTLDFNDSLEAVYLLTDGKPTAGPVTIPARIANDILHRNRWRHLNINTIGISVGGVTESFLRSLAANSGGEFRAVD